MRSIVLWIFGLLAAAIWGGLVGHLLLNDFADSGALLGTIGGLCAFACARLWATGG